MNKLIIIYTVSGTVIMLIFVLGLVQSASIGEEIYIREGCGKCHSFKGHGGALASDLTSVTHRRSKTWIMNQIKNPKAHNPDSRMPEFKHLSVIERYAISQYLKY
jgi:cbb3-type cytochrome oxidase cytochrome c subunit